MTISNVYNYCWKRWDIDHLPEDLKRSFEKRLHKKVQYFSGFLHYQMSKFHEKMGHSALAFKYKLQSIKEGYDVDGKDLFECAEKLIDSATTESESNVALNYLISTAYDGYQPAMDQVKRTYDVHMYASKEFEITDPSKSLEFFKYASRFKPVVDFMEAQESAKVDNANFYSKMSTFDKLFNVFIIFLLAMCLNSLRR